jgi:magnesium-transporting ATPase (P-type)
MVGKKFSSYSPINVESKISSKGSSDSFASEKSKNSKAFESLALGCSMNNSARIDFVDGDFKRVGEPTEAALKVLAEKIMG